MNIYQFMSDSPYLTFFLVLILIEGFYKIVNRFFRTLNIRKNGWPPEHCDADGDFKNEE